MKKRILFRIDLQNDFVHPHGALTINTPELIEKHQKFANSLFNDSFDEIIVTYDTHFEETYKETNEALLYPKHCLFASWGWQQAAPFKPDMKVTTLYKGTTNIWNELNTYQKLNQNWQEADVYLCGVLSDVCVKEALNGLLKRGAMVTILVDLCQGSSEQIADIIKKPVYQAFIEMEHLKCITSAQFFRQTLHTKKIAHNLVHKSLGE